jgi:ribonuclease HI
MDKIAHCCLIDGGSGPSVMSKIIMEELGLSCTNENARSMLSYNSLQQTTIGEIKDVTLVLCAHPEIRTTLNIQVIDMPVRNYSIILGRYWQALTGGYLSLDGTHLSIPRNGKNIIVLREGRISPYIESVPQSSVNYIEEDLGVYSIFTEEDNIPLERIDLEDELWHMHFDGSHSNEGNGAGIILVSPAGKIHNLSYRLEFACSNNVIEFEALLLGIENALNLGCGHLSVFRNSELVVNLIHKTCSPRNKLMEQYSQTVWALVSNLLSFNITHVRKELNSIVDRLVVFAASPTQQLLPHWPDCAFQSLHHPYISENEEFWKAIPNNESNCVVIQNEPLKPEEIISVENNKIPEGLTPLEGSFSLSVVGNKEKQEEEVLQLKVVEAISMKITTPGSSMNVKINVQGFDKEEMRSVELLGGFQKVFSWFNVDLCGFDLGLVQHTMKPARQKQRLVNSALKATFHRESRNFSRTEMFFLVHPKWVSKWEPTSKTIDNIRTCISLQTFRQEIMRNPFPPLSMKIFLQQVVELHLEPLLDSLFGYNKTKVKGENIHKTTFITNCDTMSYSFLPSGLLDTSITLKRPIHTTFDELVSLHVYLDDLIVCVKRMIVTSECQVLGHFQITFVLDTNSEILKELQRQWFSHNTNSPRLKYCEGPA